MRGRQAFKHLLHWRRQPVIGLVARGPKGITPRGWQRVNLEHRIVRGHRLKSNVAVPTRRSEPARVRELMGQAAPLLLLLTADDGDLVAEFAALLRQGVHVEAR